MYFANPVVGEKELDFDVSGCDQPGEIFGFKKMLGSVATRATMLLIINNRYSRNAG